MFKKNVGKKGMDAIGILKVFMGTIIRDCWAPYFNYAVRHSLCVAHLLRELVGVVDNTGQSWAQSLIDLLLAMKQTKEKFITQGKNEASPYFLQKYSQLFDAILENALLHNPIPVREPGKRGRVKRGKPVLLSTALFCIRISLRYSLRILVFPLITFKRSAIFACSKLN